jgi:hypothetical protein
MRNYVPSLCGGGPHWSFRTCKPERCLLFCVCVVIVLILVSFLLCYAPSRMFIFVLILLVFVMHICVHRLRAGSLPAFKCFSTHLLWVHAPSSRGLLFRIQELDTRIMIIPRTMCVYAGVIFFGTQHWCCWCCLFIESLGCCERRLFCLLGLVWAPGPPKASLALKHFCLRFHFFYLVCGSLEVCSFWNNFICPFVLFA